MVTFKKAGVLFTSAALGFTVFASAASAQSTLIEQQKPMQVHITSTESSVTKEDLIKKFKEIFPNKFNAIKNKDFQMNSVQYYMEDGVERFELSFNKVINGKPIYGSATFVGSQLDLENFYYSPANTSSALFPAKVSKEEAKKIALSLVKRFSDYSEYQLDENAINYYPQQLLTEPIRYSFSFIRTKNGYPIADQRMEVTVLGNGDVVNLYKGASDNGKFTFDAVSSKKPESDILKQITDTLDVRLQYQIDYDYINGKRNVRLVYSPNIKSLAVHAISGKWQLVDGTLVESYKQQSVQPLVEAPLPAKQPNLTKQQAKELAQSLLAINSDQVKLVIHSVDEVKSYNGQEVYSINYMYESGNAGHGGGLEINKKTGEVVQYYDMRDDLNPAANTSSKTPLPKEEALNKAIQYLQQWSPSYLQHYAKPIDEPYVDKTRGYTMFTFPRIVNGILVEGDMISVGIKADGSLGNLSIGYQEVEWPSLEGVITKEQAAKAYVDQLSTKLEYARDIINNERHYDLLYRPVFNNDSYSTLDAKSGQWLSLFGSEKITTVVKHPRAEAELNYLIGANILQVKEPETFNADASITQGEALSVVLKSISHFYEEYYSPVTEETREPIGNIEPSNPLYAVVERAVQFGILDDSATGFDAKAPLSRQELAKWYIRALNLEQAAEQHHIYKLNFDDANQVGKTYIGYVALADALKILPAEKNNFKPTADVSYADIAIATIKFAREMNENGNERYY